MGNLAPSVCEAMSLNRQLVDVASRPRVGPTDDVIDATPVGTTYRVVEERAVAEPSALPPRRGGLARGGAKAGMGLVHLVVAFAAMILRIPLGLMVVVGVGGAALFVVGGLVTGVGNAYNWAGVSLAFGFAGFVGIYLVTNLETWVARLAARL